MSPQRKNKTPVQVDTTKSGNTDFDVPMKTAEEIQQEERSKIYAEGGAQSWEEIQRQLEKSGLGDPVTSRAGDISNRPIGPMIPGTDVSREIDQPVTVQSGDRAQAHAGSVDELRSPKDVQVPTGGSFSQDATKPYNRESYAKK